MEKGNHFKYKYSELFCFFFLFREFFYYYIIPPARYFLKKFFFLKKKMEDFCDLIQKDPTDFLDEINFYEKNKTEEKEEEEDLQYYPQQKTPPNLLFLKDILSESPTFQPEPPSKNYEKTVQPSFLYFTFLYNTHYCEGKKTPLDQFFWTNKNTNESLSLSSSAEVTTFIKETNSPDISPSSERFFDDHVNKEETSKLNSKNMYKIFKKNKNKEIEVNILFNMLKIKGVLSNKEEERRKLKGILNSLIKSKKIKCFKHKNKKYLKCNSFL
jgi:hypothetical protein